MNNYKQIYLHLPSIVCSLMLSMEGLFNFNQIINYDNYYIDTKQSIYYTDIFISYIIIEYLIYYILKEPINLFTQHIHHILYLVFLFYLKYNNHTMVFYVFFIDEIPTFILMLGKTFKELRTDYGFIISFIITRLVYHSYMVTKLLDNAPSIFYILFGLVTTIIHFYWYYLWLLKY